MWIPGVGFTTQFDIEKPWTSCFPTHSPKDFATIIWSFRSRMQIVAENANRKDYETNRPEPLDEMLLFECAEKNDKVRGAIALSNLVQLVNSMDPDSDPLTVTTFLKAQGLKKLSKLLNLPRPNK
ncbi:12541_t:CDS:2 [Cetraspora pellucida]|uniref:12541_t:CDS:1 n=1 Tax=Cetraspora pellucida TaxID=1433469 RepID=A0A9N9C3G3_9GLOM|nr:12541_t:CDS:2 [Cetraspora pellucida]